VCEVGRSKGAEIGMGMGIVTSQTSLNIWETEIVFECYWEGTVESDRNEIENQRS
jgi:hypothetical protein